MLAGMAAYTPPVDSDALLDTYIRAINACTRGRPKDLIVSVHACRGNFKGGVWFSEGGYAKIAKKFFGDLDVDAYLVRGCCLWWFVAYAGDAA
jgi:methionine synthase II (cobalamin-independent)